MSETRPSIRSAVLCSSAPTETLQYHLFPLATDPLHIFERVPLQTISERLPFAVARPELLSNPVQITSDYFALSSAVERVTF